MFVPNIFGLLWETCLVVVESWVVSLCNAVFLREPVHCTDSVCIFLYRLIQNLDHADKSFNVADVPFFKK